MLEQRHQKAVELLEQTTKGKVTLGDVSGTLPSGGPDSGPDNAADLRISEGSAVGKKTNSKDNDKELDTFSENANGANGAMNGNG